MRKLAELIRQNKVLFKRLSGELHITEAGKIVEDEI